MFPPPTAGPGRPGLPALVRLGTGCSVPRYRGARAGMIRLGARPSFTTLGAPAQ